jgi:hypothetical protein
MALLLMMQVYTAAQLSKQRLYRNRRDPMDYLDDCEFYNRFRLTKAAVRDLADMLENDLAHPTARSYALTTVEQVMIFSLRFFATGTFYNEIADRNGVHKSTVCRTIQRFVNVMVSTHSVSIE